MWGHGYVTVPEAEVGMCLVKFVLFNKEFSRSKCVIIAYFLFLINNTSPPFFKMGSQAPSFIEYLCSISAVCFTLS